MGFGKWLKKALKPPKSVRKAFAKVAGIAGAVASVVPGLGGVVGAVSAAIPGLGKALQGKTAQVVKRAVDAGKQVVAAGQSVVGAVTEFSAGVSRGQYATDPEAFPAGAVASQSSMKVLAIAGVAVVGLVLLMSMNKRGGF